MEMIEKERARARDFTESVGKILVDLEDEYLNQGNLASVRWKRENVKQMLQRERKKANPNIPKTLGEYDSSQGAIVMDSGSNKNLNSK